MKILSLFGTFFLALASFWVPSVTHASVVLTATPLRAIQGQPLTVTVEIQNQKPVDAAPVVPGLDQITKNALATQFFESSSVQVMATSTGTNTVRTQNFSWILRPGAEGKFFLGPVTIENETSSGVTVQVSAQDSIPTPLPASKISGDERVAAEHLEIASTETSQPAGVIAQWIKIAQDHPLVWVIGLCGALMIWLALRTYTFLKRIEHLSSRVDAVVPNNPPLSESLIFEGEKNANSFADQAIALVRAHIAQVVGRDVSHLSSQELANLEPQDHKRALAHRMLALVDALRFGNRVEVQDEIRQVLREYLA